MENAMEGGVTPPPEVNVPNVIRSFGLISIGTTNVTVTPLEMVGMVIWPTTVLSVVSTIE
jgi:hypothetical protein